MLMYIYKYYKSFTRIMNMISYYLKIQVFKKKFKKYEVSSLLSILKKKFEN